MNAAYDSIKGCLVGGAAGDALGYPVEFTDEKKIRKEFGENGIQEYVLSHGEAIVSDDTQMTLFTAAGLLLTEDPLDYEDYIHCMEAAYREWFLTQTSKQLKKENCRTWLSGVPALDHSRAPGITCLESLKKKTLGSIESPLNNSKGNGGVMRIAPVGLFYNENELSPEEIDRRGAQAAALTHGHPLGYISAAGLVHIIYLLTHIPGMTIQNATEDMLKSIPKVFPGSPEMCAEFCKIIRKAVELSKGTLPDKNCIRILGKGFVAEEALAIAVFCCFRHSDDFDAVLRSAVNIDGDSDSTGAIAGNIMGAYLGYSRLPAKYTENLELMDVMERMSKEIAESIESRSI